MKLDPTDFVAQVDAAFTDALTPFGFVATGKNHYDDWYASRTFRSGDRYVEINANCHFRDGDPECRVILGEGPDDWPDYDWNSIALWRLGGIGGNYPVQEIEDIPNVLDTMCQDLLEQAEDFLSGDVDRFLKIRAAQNRDREPYKIYRPQSDGSYQESYEPDSQKLKERYSDEKKK